MSTLNLRIPARLEIISLWMICIFLSHIWTILRFFREVPVYIRRMSFFDLVGVFSYTQIFALLESLVLLGIFVAVAIILPGAIFREKFLAQGAMMAVAIYFWGTAAHYQARILQWLSWSLNAYMVLLASWMISFVTVLIGLSVWIRKDERVEKIILAFVERISLLSLVYLFIDGLSLLVVLYRNLF